MKILQICAAYKPAFIYGGPTMSVSMLSESLNKAGVSTEVFATTANGIAELPVIPNSKSEVDGVCVTYFKRVTKDHSHFSPGLLIALNKESNSFTVIHIHAWWNLVSIFACFIALKNGSKVILSPRGTLSSYSFNHKKKGLKKILHQISLPLLQRCHIHATSEIEATAIKELFEPVSITILPNFVKLPNTSIDRVNNSNSILKLLFLSRIDEKKGLDILIEALKSVNIAFSLTIAGSGDVSYVQFLKGLIEKYNLSKKVTWAGFLNEDKFNTLSQHDLLVLPSQDENFGNVVIESLSVGTAVLISDKVGLSEYVKSNKLGWICQANPDSVNSFIEDIGKNQISELEKISKKAPNIIIKDFNQDVLVQRYVEMYCKINT